MHVKLHAFPVVYFTLRCVKHDCWVEVGVIGSTDRSDRHVIAGSLTAMRCEKGGAPAQSNCSHTWEISISGPGDVTVTNS